MKSRTLILLSRGNQTSSTTKITVFKPLNQKYSKEEKSCHSRRGKTWRCQQWGTSSL